MITPIITKEKLIHDVERLVRDDELTYVESLIAICEKLDVEPEEIARIIPPALKDKIRGEAQRSRRLPSPNINHKPLFDE